MAGALNAVADDPEQAQTYAPTDDELDAAPSGGGALQLAQNQPNPYAEGLYKTGQRLLGDENDPQGALNRFQGVPAARATAADDQRAAIKRAMSRLQAAGKDQYDVPALNFYAALGRPTTSGYGSEGLANATDAFTAAYQKQKSDEARLAEQLGGLDIAGGNISSNLINTQAGDYQRQVQEGRQFQNEAASVQERQDAAELAYQRALDVARANVAGRQGVAETNVAGRQTVAEIQAQSRRDAAEAYAGSRVTVAQIGAEKNRFVYEGTMPSNQNIGVWTDKTTGEVKYGPAVAGKAGATSGQTMQIINALRQENPDLTFADALALSKKTPNASAEQLRREGMALTAAKGDIGYFSDPEGTWSAWRKRMGLPETPFATPPSSAPAARPAAAPAAPTTVPPRPAAAPAPSAAPPPAQVLPPQARALLKEGVVTTFGNGQQWVLRNGQPVRLK